MSKLNESVLESYFQAFADTALDSPNSYRKYLSTIKEWEKFVGSEKALDIGVGDVFSFVSSLKGKEGFTSRYDKSDTKLTYGTIRHKITILKTYYRYLLSLERVTKNPFENPQFLFKKKHDAPKRPAELVPFDQVQKLFDTIPGTSKPGIRDRALYALLFGCGLRRSEAQKLTLSSIVHHPVTGPHICILKGKTGSRTVGIGDWAYKYLNAVIIQRMSEGADPLSYLFVNYTVPYETPSEKPVSVDAIYDRLKSYCVLAGLPADTSPHWGRVTFATKARAEGASYEEIQSDTGHKRATTVEGYIKKHLPHGAAKKIAF